MLYPYKYIVALMCQIYEININFTATKTNKLQCDKNKGLKNLLTNMSANKYFLPSIFAGFIMTACQDMISGKCRG